MTLTMTPSADTANGTLSGSDLADLAILDAYRANLAASGCSGVW